MSKRVCYLFCRASFLIVILLFLVSVKLVAQTTILGYGDNVQRAINGGGENAFGFSGSSEDHITLFVVTSSGAISIMLEAVIYDPDGVLVSSASGNRIRINTTLHKTGTFTLLIKEKSGSTGGGYGLTLRRLISPAAGIVIPYGTSTMGRTMAVAEIDSYIFTGSPGDLITLWMVKTSGFTAYNPVLELYDPDGLLLRRFEGFVIRMDTTLHKAGNYTIWIMNNNGIDVGGFSISLQRLLSPPGGTVIAYGTNLHDGTSATGEIDPYIFSGSSNDLIHLKVETFKGFSLIPPVVELYDPNGILLMRSAGYLIQATATLPTTGTYTVWILHESAYYSNGYDLSLSCPDCSPLPVKWLFFKSLQQGKWVQLTWSTALEEKSKAFVVERSLDGKEFNPVSVVQAGGSNQAQTYAFTDQAAATLRANVLYYRLKQLDVDGKYTYSAIVRVLYQQADGVEMLYAYPNPYSGTITLRMTNTGVYRQSDKAELFSTDGRLLYRRSLSGTLNTDIVLDDLPVLTRGTYVLRTWVSGKPYINKIIRE